MSGFLWETTVMSFGQRRCVLCAIFGLFLFSTRILYGADVSAIPLKKGERILFLGDSITQAGVNSKGYITVIRNALDKKYQDLGIVIIGAGISGNKVPDLLKRVDRDVIARKPTIVFIYIGINDVWHGEKDAAKGTPKDKFEAGLNEVIGKITSAGVKVILCTPSVIGEKHDGSNKLDSKLDEYAEISRKIAKERKIPLCDLRKEFIKYLKENNPQNREQGILTSDRVHLNEAGNRFVADVMLKYLGN
jgi:isoamyl acetate esterase